MKRILSTTLAFLLTGVVAICQDIPFDKKLFKDQKKEFKEAEDQFEDGMDWQIDGAYHHALDFYLKAYEFNPKSAELNFRIGLCYMLSPSDVRTDCLPYFEKAYELNPGVRASIHYFLGRAYHYHEEWDKAIEEYKRYSNAFGNSPPIEDIVAQGLEWAVHEELYASLYKRIEECEVGKRLSLKPIRVFIDNAGPTVNSEYADFGPVINADESRLFFTSRRAGSTGGKTNDQGEFFEDIYEAEEAEGVGEWKQARNLGEPVNSKKHDAAVGLSPDGNRIIVYEEGDLYESVKQGNEWSKPKKLSKEINTKYVESSATYSFDGKKLYFVSDREDLTKGGRDIFVSQLGPDGEWGEPENLGFAVNTEYDEEGVFLHPDGRTMYFSSRGHESMGGYDVFKTVYDKGKWSVPENLGYPINTPDNDVYFVVDATGKRGYYASVRKGGLGEKDIYRITVLGPEKPLNLQTEDLLLASAEAPMANILTEKAIETDSKPLTLFKGKVIDEETKDPILASLEIADNASATTINELNSNGQTGKFLMTLPAGRNYGIAVKAKGYLFHSENFDIPDNSGYLEVEKVIELRPIKPGKLMVLRNIFFDFDKASLRPESERELENVLAVLEENPGIKVELSGHTDNKGSAAYNKDLSERRAKSVVQYLVDKGIDQSRLVYEGYGFEQPIATNETEQGRQLNRRTEFKVIAVD